MRLRVLAAAAVAVALAATLLVAGVASGGGDDSGPLGWKGKVLSFRHPSLPTDHVVSGTLRDDSLQRVRVVSRTDIKVVDEHGDPLPTAAVFTQTFGHGLFDPTRMPYARLPERELMRIGDVGRFEPGGELPVTISWRERPGGPKGVRIAYPGGTLSIPR